MATSLNNTVHRIKLNDTVHVIKRRLVSPFIGSPLRKGHRL
jgi:hypothetical protein